MTIQETPSNEPSPLPEEAFLKSAQPRARKKSRVLFWLAVTFGLLGVMCFGGCLVFSSFCEARRFTVPAEVLAVAHEIVPIALPEGYAGELAESVETPLFTVKKTIFRHESGKGMLSLLEIQMIWSLMEQDEAASEKAFDQFLADFRQLNATEELAQTIAIQGEPAEFQIRAGRDALSSTQLHEIRGVFRGRSGKAQLWLQAEDAVWNAAQIDQMLKSLQD